MYVLKDPQSGKTIEVTPSYQSNRPFFCFSNFSRHSVTMMIDVKGNGDLKPESFKSSEPAYHFFKIDYLLNSDGSKLTAEQRVSYYKTIKKAETPHAAMLASKQWSKENQCTLNDGENSIDGLQGSPKFDNPYTPREQIMFNIVYAKVTQHPAIQKLLLATGKSCHVEDTATAAHYEAIWGWGDKGEGKNLLGITLMRVRDEIFTEEKRYDMVLGEMLIQPMSKKACEIRQKLGQKGVPVEALKGATRIEQSRIIELTDLSNAAMRLGSSTANSHTLLSPKRCGFIRFPKEIKRNPNSAYHRVCQQLKAQALYYRADVYAREKYDLMIVDSNGRKELVEMKNIQKHLAGKGIATHGRKNPHPISNVLWFEAKGTAQIDSKVYINEATSEEESTCTVS